MSSKFEESSRCELKESFPEKGQIIKTSIAFCNSHGGKIIIGIRDDGQVLGVSEDEIQSHLEFLNKQIFDSCSPPIIPQVYSSIMDGHHVLIIEVSSGMNKPYFISNKGMNDGTYVRIGRSTMKATPELIQELQWQSRGLSYDSLPCYSSLLDELDPKSLMEFAKGFNIKTAECDKTFLRSHGLVIQEHGRDYLSHAASLLFGIAPQQHHPEAFIIATCFKGSEGRESLDSRDFMGSLASQIQSTISFILSHIGVRYTIREAKRDERPTIPEIAIREAVINAVVHRNYHIPSPIKVAIYENRVEIFNPGGFPAPIAEHDFKMGISHIRNIVIARVMRHMGYVEKLGSGLMTIVDSCLKEGLMHPSVVDGGSYTKVILYKGFLGKAAPSAKLDDEMDQILNLIIKEGDVATRDVVDSLRMSKTTVIRKLNQLCELGLIEKRGKARSVRYRSHP